MKHLNGYYMDGSRLALVRSFNEGMTALYFDSLNKGIVRLSHDYAGAFKPLSFDDAIATGLHDATEYVDQVRRYPIVDKLAHEPMIGLLILDPSQYRPGVTLRSGMGSLWLTSVHAYVGDPASAILTFRAPFTFFDRERDDERTIEASRGIAVPRGLVDNFDLAVYRTWLKGALKIAETALEKHVTARIAELKEMLPPYRP